MLTPITFIRNLNTSGLTDPATEVGNPSVDGWVAGTATIDTPWGRTDELPAAAHLAGERAAAVAVAGATLVLLAHTDVVVTDHAAPASSALAAGVYIDIGLL